MKNILSLLFLLLPISLLSQNKLISGNFNFAEDGYNKLIEDIGGKNFRESQDEFNFRVRYSDAVIEITKNNDSIQGHLTSYVYKINENSKILKTKYKTQALSDSVAARIYKKVLESGIKDIRSDNEIRRWMYWTDSTHDVFEFGDTNTYQIKTYMNPHKQDSISGVAIVADFLQQLISIVDIKSNSKELWASLPHNGCYAKGEMLKKCYQTSSFELGLTTTSQLPYGYFLSYQSTYIGDTFTGIGFIVDHKFDFRGN